MTDEVSHILAGYSLMEHTCTMKGTQLLRWLRKPHKSLAVHSMELQQAWQCVYCGRVKWQPVETVTEEDITQ